LLPDVVWSNETAYAKFEQRMGYPFGNPVVSAETPLDMALGRQDPIQGPTCGGIPVDRTKPETIATPKPDQKKPETIVTPVLEQSTPIQITTPIPRFDPPIHVTPVLPVEDRMPTVLESTSSSGAERKTNVKKQESSIWKGFKPHRGEVKTNAAKGKRREYYEWDFTHDDIEVYDHAGDHKGSMDPVTGEMYKPPVIGRDIRNKIR
jgi:hypothetical protein